MKKITSIFMMALMFFVSQANAQTVDEIISKYLTHTGGLDKWKAITSIKMDGNIKVQGLDLPLNIYQSAPNYTKTLVVFQGKEIVQDAFDGETAWGTNFMTQKNEKKTSEEAYNMIDASQILDPFIDYAARGYKVTLEGSETIEGVDCHKIKLTRKPVKVDGKEEENFSFYYFDKEANVIIAIKSAIKSGPAKGMVQESYMSNYTEVNGLYFPMEMTQKMNGETAASIVFTKVTLNEKMEKSIFEYKE